MAKILLEVFNNGYQYTGYSWLDASKMGAPSYYNGELMDNESICELVKVNETNKGTIYAVKQKNKHYLIEHNGVRLSVLNNKK